MHDVGLVILLVALLLDWYLGEPEFLWSRLPHPIVLFGKAVASFDRLLNDESDTDAIRYRKGSVAIVLLVGLSIALGFGLEFVAEAIGAAGLVLETFIVFVLLAQKSLHDHVKAVADGLLSDGLEGGRKAVGMIVGRDPSQLDETGVSRAGIESLAENFSDGVVAPAFWYAVFGLPGIIAYKMINTADSMIGYRNEKYLWFGRAAAQLDDLANWVPARLSVIFIAVGSGVIRGIAAMRQAVLCAFRDAGLHRSPNAGWPEAAMAGGMDIALGGPRTYENEIVAQAYLNSSGKKELTASDIIRALMCFKYACFALWVGVGCMVLLF